MPDKFDAHYFKRTLNTSWLGSEFIYLEKTDSTNSYLKNIPTSELVHGTLVLTDHQKKGRGQYERKWEAEPYKNLTFTIAFRPKTSERLNLLTLSVALSIAQTLETLTTDTVNIKWPNDIIIRNKKIGGLLTECTFNGSNPDRVLIGVGLNVGQQQFSKGVTDTAISFRKVSSHPISREDLLKEILNGVEHTYHRWHKQDDSLKNDISKKLMGYGEWVELNVNGELKNKKFKFIGVNSNGELMMLNEQLDVNKFIHEQVRIITGSQGVQKPETGTSV